MARALRIEYKQIGGVFIWPTSLAGG